jgi:hypothetical protein
MTISTFARCLLLTGILLLPAAMGRARPLPFGPGEKLVYEVRWEQVPVAQVRLEVRPFGKIQGEQAFHFAFRARTYSALDILYRVDGRIEAFTNLDVTRSLRLVKDMHEGRSRRVFRVDFDWQQAMATYVSGGGRERRLALPEGTLDLLSIVYYARSLALEEGLIVSRPLCSGKKTLVVSARMEGRESILVGGQLRPAFRIAPDVRRAGQIFKKSKKPKLLLWISDDAERIPLKVVGKVWVGAFIAELIAASP